MKTVLLNVLEDSLLIERLFLGSVELFVLGGLVWLVGMLGWPRSHRVVALLWALVLVKPVMTLTLGSPIGISVIESTENERVLGFAESTGLTSGASGKSLALRASPSLPAPPPESSANNDGVNLAGSVSLSEGEALGAALGSEQPIAVAAADDIEVSTVLSRAWLGGIAFFLFWHGVNRWRLRRLWLEAEEADEGTFDAYGRAAAALDLGKDSLPQLRVSSRLDSPAIAGLLRPTIYVPAWLEDRVNREELEWSLRHELTHWKWRDPFAIWGRDVATLLFFFHPLAWFAGKRMTEAVEKACDRAMLKRASEAEDYAHRLHSVLEKMRRQRRPVIAGGLFATRTQVGRRLEALLGYARRKRLNPQLTWSSGVFLVGMAIAVLLLGAVIGQEPREGLYESAPSTKIARAITIGPNRFKLKVVEPSDGAIEFRWEPGSDFYDVIELRVFDSDSEELIAGIGENGRQLAAGTHAEYTEHGVRLEPREERLPAKVDLWLRVHSYDRPLAEQVKADVGFSAKFGESKITTVQMMVGTKPYTTKRGQDGKTVVEFSPDDSLRMNQDTETTVVFRQRGELLDGKYQVCAVDKGGMKFWAALPHYIDFGGVGDPQVVTFPVNAAGLSHFEWRRFGGRHRFYFEAVLLPELPDPTPLAVMERLQGTWLDPSFHPDHWHHFTKSGTHIRVSGTAGFRRQVGIVGLRQNDKNVTLTLEGSDYHLTWKTVDQLELQRVGRADIVRTLFRSGKRGVAQPDPVLTLALEETISRAKKEAIQVAGTWAVFDEKGNQELWMRYHNHGSAVGLDLAGEGVFARDSWKYQDGTLSWKTPLWSSFKIEWIHEDEFRGDGRRWRRAGERGVPRPDQEISKRLNTTRIDREETEKAFRRFIDLALSINGDALRKSLDSLARNQWVVLYLDEKGMLMRVLYTNNTRMTKESGKTLSVGGIRGGGSGRAAGEYRQEIALLLEKLGQSRASSLSSETFPGVLFSFVEPTRTIKMPRYATEEEVLAGAEEAGFVCLVTENFERPGEWGMATDEMRLRVRPDRDFYEQGEAMLFWLDLENVGKQPVEVKSHDLFPLFTIEVDGKLYRLDSAFGSEVLVAGQPATEMLQPGSSITDIPFVVDSDWNLLQPNETKNLRLEPGRHKIRVRQPELYSGKWIGEGKAWTNTLEFEVKR